MNATKRRAWTALALVAFAILAVFARRTLFPLGGSGEIENRKVKGPMNAAIHIVDYSDFQCPACAKVVEPVEALIAEFPGEVRIEFRHYPLDMAHKWALTAAIFAECAAEQGRFWEYHDRLYAEQKNWSNSTDAVSEFAAYTRGLGLDGGQLEQCVSSAKTLARIRNEQALGTKQGVRSTPTFFINGKVFVGTPQLKTAGREFILQELNETPDSSGEV